MIEKKHKNIATSRQCELLGLARSSLYYKAKDENPENLLLKRLLDEEYTRRPFYGVRRMSWHLKKHGHGVGEKRTRRLLRDMGLMAVYPKRGLSKPCKYHRVYPYLLRNVKATRPDQVWAADITYIRLSKGFVYLVAIIDLFSRKVLSWRISNTLDAGFCVDALKEALLKGRPEIFNTDQGSQFTSREFTGILEAAGIRISMDGRGRAFDNIFVERLWRSVKYEEVYLKDYADPVEARGELRRYFRFYNEERPHQALQYRTPAEVYFAGQSAGIREGSAASRTVAGTPVALRAPSVPATVGLRHSHNAAPFWS